MAIIAHDVKKAEVVQFLNEHKEALQAENINLIFIGTTGNKPWNSRFINKSYSTAIIDISTFTFLGKQAT